MNKLIILILLSVASPLGSGCEAFADTTRQRRAEVRVMDKSVYFPQSGSRIDERSQKELDRFGSMLDSVIAADKVTAVEISGSSSVDGPENYNLRLSGDRASALFLYLFNDRNLDPSLFRFQSLGENWTELQRLMAASESLPGKEKAITIAMGSASPSQKEYALRYLDGGKTWRYLVDNIFPHLRYASVKVDYEKHPSMTQLIEFEESESYNLEDSLAKANLKVTSTPPQCRFIA